MELTLDQALKEGIEAHKAGKAQEADRYYTAILKVQPKHPEANHNMGVLAVAIGKVEEALPFFKTALDVNPSMTQFWISYIEALIKLDRIADAEAVFGQAISNGIKSDEFDKLDSRLAELGKGLEVNSATFEKPQEPSAEQIQSLIKQYSRGQYSQALNKASQLLQHFPKSIDLYNIVGAINKKLGKLEEAIQACEKALSIEPEYAEGYNNMGIILKNQGDLEKATQAYKKAISLKPNFAEAYGNMGAILQEQGKLEKAAQAYKKAISLKPNFAEAYCNMGAILQEQGDLEKAAQAYKKAISIKPDYAEPYNNIGIILKNQGELNKAIEAYNKAISIKPDYAEAHRNLSNSKKYKVGDCHFISIEELYKRNDLSEDTRCNLSFALAKIYEDLGELDKAFSHLYKGNSLRKKLLGYSIDQDKKLFETLKEAQPNLLKNTIKIKERLVKPTPIFILGMPRSGTTLVEQIISRHSEVTGAGELSFVDYYGGKLAMNSNTKTTLTVYEFRKKYLSELSELSNGKHFVTDKMPQNFLYIPLIVSALPEAKIIHVDRDPAATCWSNFKQYFAKGVLGYCYDLRDIVTYYKLYKDLMNFWQSEYSDRIYNLNYENLTTDQENQTKKLIEHLDLSWEEACLSPHKNKRTVKTASQQQVRQQIYQGSSKAWRKYEPFLNGAFDSLLS